MVGLGLPLFLQRKLREGIRAEGIKVYRGSLRGERLLTWTRGKICPAEEDKVSN